MFFQMNCAINPSLLDLVTAETIRLLFSPNNSESTIFKNNIWILLYNYFCLHRVNPALNTVIRVFIQMFKLGIVLKLLFDHSPSPFFQPPWKVLSSRSHHHK